MTRIIAILAAAIVALGLGVIAFFVFAGGRNDRFADCRSGTVAGGRAAIGGPFSLIDGDGDRVTDAQVINKPTLVYFGYTFCPDFCPTDLARNAVATGNLAEHGIDVGQVFVSIDPARDTPEVVKDFTGFIDPDLIGLTGTDTEVKAAADAYKVYFRKAGDDPEFYTMDHSTFTYLMAPGVGFLDFFRSDARPEEVADRVECFVADL